ncbi:4'-phosphopantetheinyl transferase superfamily protein [Sphingomonas sp.]|uniref:4'-phosphopantetheinyl transferase family protein n=1 Tax=Sphingomonas sp. TaxID=28214 RepID=UPI0031D48A75
MSPIRHRGALDALDWDGARAVAWRVPDDGARHRAAAALVAYLSRQPAGAVQLHRSPAGQPRVAYPPGWFISLSARGGQVLIGAARQPIGVDRECLDGEAPLWDMLTPAEARALRAIPAAAWSRGWTRLWTIKEAHAKRIGEPRRIAPEAIETQLIDAVRATACFEGVSDCWSEDCGDAIETIALGRTGP